LRTVRTSLVVEPGCDDVGVRILLIEDDRRLAELLIKRLHAEGHEAEMCNDGIEGLALAGSAAVDLVIADVMLPGMDGSASHWLGRWSRRKADGCGSSPRRAGA
jgi:DNA-binding response OmpR family regulator